MTYADEVLADDPFAWYRMDETSGTTFVGYNYLGNNHNGVWIGSPALGQPPLIATGTSVGFSSGNFAAVNYANLTGGIGGDICAECWFSAPAGNTTRMIWRKVASSRGSLVQMNTNGTLSATSFYFASYTITTPTAVRYDDGQTHYVVFIRDATAGVQRLYVDDVEVASGSIATGNNYGSAGDLTVGNAASGSASSPFVGTLDELCIYDGLRSLDRFTARYASGLALPPPPTPAVLSGAGVATSTAIGTLTATRALRGTATAASSATGALTAIRALSGAGTAVASGTGALGIAGVSYLTGHGTATSSGTGTLTVVIPPRPLTGAGTALSTATGVLTVIRRPGDYPDTAFELVGTSGTQAIDLATMTTDSGEYPALQGDLSHTAWLTHTSDIVGTLTATITAPAAWDGVLEAFGGDLQPLGTSGIGELATAVSPGQQVYLRVHPLLANDAPTDVAISWTSVLRTSEIIFDVDSPLDETPGSVNVVIANVDTETTYSIDLLHPSVSNPILSGDIGPDGSVEESVPIPELPAGDYLLELTVGTDIVTNTLTILNDPLDTTPEPDEFDVDPELDLLTEPDPDDVVRHWRFVHPETLDSWTLPHNPTRWSGTNMQNVASFEYDSSAAPDGRLLTWQQAERPRPFDFEGYVDTKAHYEGLQQWCELHRRFWLIDHRNRRWLITLEHFDPRRRIVPNKPWAHDYTITGYYFSGPHPPQIPS